MYEELNSFDPRHYIRQKALRIIYRNKGTKLSIETLAMLAHAGLRLVPPINTQILNT
jgi:hypothetical protein